MVDKFQSVQGITNQLENGYEYYFVIYNDEIAGYFGIQLQSDSLFLSKLYLKKDFRGKGISSQMLEYIKNIEFKIIFLYVSRETFKEVYNFYILYYNIFVQWKCLNQVRIGK